MSKFSDELRSLHLAFYKKEDELIAKYRDEVIVPFCDKKNLRFVSGMGGWSLMDTKGRYHGDEWEGIKIPKYVRDVLEAEVAQHNHGAGALMEDYTPEGWVQED